LPTPLSLSLSLTPPSSSPFLSKQDQEVCVSPSSNRTSSILFVFRGPSFVEERNREQQTGARSNTTIPRCADPEDAGVGHRDRSGGHRQHQRRSHCNGCRCFGGGGCALHPLQVRFFCSIFQCRFVGIVFFLIGTVLRNYDAL